MPTVEISYPPVALVRVVNGVARAVVHTPLRGALPGWFALLRFTGRRTGRTYEVPVNGHRNDGTEGTLMVLTGAPWRVNFRGGRDVDVTTADGTSPMRGVLVENTPTVARAYQQKIEELGLRQGQRQLAIKINVPRVPTTEELEASVKDQHLSIIWLKPRSTAQNNDG